MGFWSRLFGGGGNSEPSHIDYSDRTDDELRALAAARGDLTEVAQAALQSELDRRGLAVRPNPRDVLTPEHELGMFGGRAGPSGEADAPAPPEVEEAWALLQQATSLLFEHQDYQAVIPRCERVLELVRNSPEDEPWMSGTAWHLIGKAHTRRERWEPAQRPLEQSVEAFGRAGEDSAQEVQVVSCELAEVLQHRGLNEEAERRLRHAVEHGRTALPGEAILANTLEMLAQVLQRRGFATEAAAFEAEARAIHDAIVAQGE